MMMELSHRLRPSEMGIIWATMMLTLRHLIKTHPDYADYDDAKLDEILNQYRDFYADLGVSISLDVQNEMTLHSEYLLKPETAIELFRRADARMNEKLASYKSSK